MQTNLNENQLIDRLKRDDALAFDSLFKIYGTKLYSFALKYLRSESESEELVQEVFVKIWENRKALKTDLSFKSYLFTIALNQIRKYFNKRAITLNYLNQLGGEDFETNKTVESIDYASLLKRVDEIVDGLPDRKKLIFQKSRKEGKSSKEIATELEITIGTVDNQISDALKIIREALRKEDLALLLFLTLFL
ncbi:RNA polymerase sigma factor [Mangrovibacterium diazotrophicum]|uniref:RNA polymerase sigma factor n=1 Tax=Mangrovibacterium diazotrophicum TaxID=1261403 RepID=A0A419W3F0_9BACT|nr:RNA polymerase sigma-70 factor [Mangrovibacterium diazotrophicum]RKD89830.1 RNA polymerase sigma-70 factor (ECF subfamily) [Mangrovibacterium diazotrophicum]